MEPVNVHEAKTHLSRLLDRVEAGEEVVLARSGRPVARLVPVAQPIGAREPGSARGKISLREDFDDPLPDEIARAFE